jgi:hypothetical protein
MSDANEPIVPPPAAEEESTPPAPAPAAEGESLPLPPAAAEDDETPPPPAPAEEAEDDMPPPPPPPDDDDDDDDAPPPPPPAGESSESDADDGEEQPVFATGEGQGHKKVESEFKRDAMCAMLDDESSRLEKGMYVLAVHPDHKNWEPAKVVEVHGEGGRDKTKMAYSVEFDDNVSLMKVRLMLTKLVVGDADRPVRLVPSPSRFSPSAPLRPPPARAAEAQKCEDPRPRRHEAPAPRRATQARPYGAFFSSSLASSGCTAGTGRRASPNPSQTH